VRTWTFGPADGVPAPIAPFSHAIEHAGLLYLTGQMPIDPATGQLVAGGVTEQTDAVLANLEHVLRSCNASLDSVISARAYLTSIELYAEFNLAYARWFRPPLPVRTCIAVTGLAVGALVEIDFVAASDGSVRSSDAAAPSKGISSSKHGSHASA
jgi:2-iminobutanoate/2-iminopropanoate deaminase